MGVIALPRVRHLTNRETQRRRYLALATAVLLLAAGLRLWGLAHTPPGLHHDEAFHLLSARAIVNGAGVPVYITGNQGNEPMFAYLASLTLRLVGEAPWAGRLAAAWVGLLSVALTLRAGREMFPERSVGLWAGLALAVLYWHLSISRWGSQPILAAAAAAGTLLGLWRGARTGAWWAYALAGASLAFGLWSYVAFRLFPAVPLAAGLTLLASPRAPRGRLLAGGLLAAGTALVLYAPLAWYFVQNPAWFFNRYNQIGVAAPGAASPAAGLLAHAVDVGAGLFLPGRGDLDWRQNLSGRPAFDLVQVAVVAVGCLAALRRWRSPETLALAAWVVVGLAPAVLTEFPPQFGRTVMVTPALALLLGLGAEAVWGWGRGQPWARLGLVVALAASGALTVRDYFVRWANDAHLFIAFDTGLHQAAEALRQAGPGAALYETPVYREYPTLEYTLGPEAYERLRAFNGRACTVLPAVTRAPTTYAVILAEDTRTVPALQAAFPAGVLRLGPSVDGAPYAAYFDIGAGQTAQPGGVTPAGAEFGSLLELRSFHLGNDALAPGEELALTLTWALTQPTPAALTSFVHLIGPPQADGSIVYAQRDSQPCDNAYPTWQWQPGEVLADYLTLPLPEALPAGTYDLNVGWYDAETQQRLPLTGPQAGPDAASGSYKVGTLLVEP